MRRTLAQIYDSWLNRQRLRKDGGPGSGNFGHAGIPGTRGGSAPSGTTAKHFSLNPKEGYAGKSINQVHKALNGQKDGSTIKVSLAGKQLFAEEGSRGILKYNASENKWTDIDTGEVYDPFAMTQSILSKSQEGTSAVEVVISSNPNEKNREAVKKTEWESESPTPISTSGLEDTVSNLSHSKEPVKFSSTPEAYTQERKDNALWCQSYQESRAEFGGYERDCFDKFSYSEESAVIKYTGSSYSEINSALREDRASKSYYSSTIRLATSAIEKCSLAEDTWVERGVGEKGACALLGIPSISAATVSKLVGKQVTEKGFCSTSAAKGTSFGKTVTYNIYCPKGTKAVYTSSHSNFKTENEMLLQQGTQFRITKAELGGNGHLYIDMDVVAQNPVSI